MVGISDFRKRFPQIKFMDHHKESYLDTASTSLKMDVIFEVLKRFYEREVSNVHRGEHHLSLQATRMYEQARWTVADFLGAEDPSEIVFTRNSTEGLNLLATVLERFVNPEDEILVTEMEHHSNFLPWQNLAQRLNLKFKVAPVDEQGALDLNAFKTSLTPKTKIVSLAHVSNVTGLVNPLEKIIPWVRKTPAVVIVDAAQSVSFLPVDVQKMDCDFLVFSGHKIFAPSGIGVLYGKRSWLEKIPPYQRGGGTIFKVSLTHTEWAKIPCKFEAGTPFIEGALALSSVLTFLKKEIDFKQILQWEKQLLFEAEETLSAVPGLRFIGPPQNRTNILSFVVEGINPSDLSFLLSKQKLALRAGHHCCMPLMEKLNLPFGALRASFSVYSRKEDIKALKKGLIKALNLLKS